MGSEIKKIRKIHVVHLTTDSNIGGTEKMILETVLCLDKNRFKSTVITLIGGGELEKICEQIKIPYFSARIKSKLDFLAIIRLYKILKNLHIDILHTYLFHSNIIGRILGRLLKVPVIVSGQRNVDLWRKPYHNCLDRLTAQFCSLIISNSYAGKSFLIEKTGIPENKIKVIHNGIDIKKYVYHPVAEHKPTNIVCVASLTEKKGHEYLLRALSKININYNLHLIGTGKIENDLKTLCKTLNISNNVFFEGYQKDVRIFLKNADIFILPSLWEGIPVALLEAMACGIPCIASRTGGIIEVIKNGEDGILIEPKNIDKIAGSIVELTCNENLKKMLSVSARKKIENLFSNEKMIHELESVYTKLIDGKEKSL